MWRDTLPLGVKACWSLLHRFLVQKQWSSAPFLSFLHILPDLSSETWTYPLVFTAKHWELIINYCIYYHHSSCGSLSSEPCCLPSWRSRYPHHHHRSQCQGCHLELWCTHHPGEQWSCCNLGAEFYSSTYLTFITLQRQARADEDDSKQYYLERHVTWTNVVDITGEVIKNWGEVVLCSYSQTKHWDFLIIHTSLVG